MPTGYTEIIKEGATFSEFVWRCARAFGALIEMRDHALDAKIPDELKPSIEYDEKRLVEAEAALIELQNLSADECDRRAHADFSKRSAEHEKSIASRRSLKHQYENMLDDVRLWKPPTGEHVELKEFMIRQLEESIGFDCREFDDWKPKLLTGHEWLAQRIESENRCVANAKQHIADEIRRTNARNAWIKALRESVPMPVTK